MRRRVRVAWKPDPLSEAGRAEIRELVERAVDRGWIRRGVVQRWAQPPRRKDAWTWGGERRVDLGLDRI